MSKIGYARVSTTEQHLDRQKEKLEKEGCEKIFMDKWSGASKNRPALKSMLEYIRDGDIVIVTELDRLGRSSEDLTDIMNIIQKKEATLEVLNLPSLRGIEDENLRRLLNNIILELYKYQAEQERKKIRERQDQGIQIAKASGKYHGRKPMFDLNSSRIKLAISLYQERESSGRTIRDIAEMTGINRRTLDRYLIAAGVKTCAKNNALRKRGENAAKSDII